MNQMDKDIEKVRRKKFKSVYADRKPIPDVRFIDYIKEYDNDILFRCLVHYQMGEYKSWPACLKDIIRQDPTLEEFCYPKGRLKKVG
jgi:hypothetical protein